jgi:hypothetical protein
MATKPQTTLNRCLREAGIQPIAFAYFLTQFIKRKEPKKNRFQALLIGSLKAQAELIVYHINRPEASSIPLKDTR